MQTKWESFVNLSSILWSLWLPFRILDCPRLGQVRYFIAGRIFRKDGVSVAVVVTGLL
jgi:hypothetical protein